MELDGKEGERIVPRHENPDRDAGIFDDLLMRFIPRLRPGS